MTWNLNTLMSFGLFAGVIRSLVNSISLQCECARVLLESLLVPVLTYSSETMKWKKKKRSRIRAVQMFSDNLAM